MPAARAAFSPMRCAVEAFHQLACRLVGHLPDRLMTSVLALASTNAWPEAEDLRRRDRPSPGLLRAADRSPAGPAGPCSVMIYGQRAVLGLLGGSPSRATC